MKTATAKDESCLPEIDVDAPMPTVKPGPADRPDEDPEEAPRITVIDAVVEILKNLPFVGERV